MTATTDSHDHVKMFHDGWQIYQKLLHGNYMFHQQINAALRRFCLNYFHDPITVLELGCGDASQSMQLLAELPIRHYSGYDVSPIALLAAEHTLQEKGVPFRLVCADMLTAVANPAPQADLILCSYALHHLSLAEKRQLLGLARQCLRDQGLFILIDIVKEDNQSLEAFHTAYLTYADQHWTALTRDELQVVHQHVRHHDFPEDLNQYQQLASQAGFAKLEHMNCFTWHHTVLFYTQPHQAPPSTL